MSSANKAIRIGSAALIVAVNLAIVALVGEGIVRLAYDPAEYLQPRLVDDDILTFTLDPDSPGHDELGFRNTAVPERADVVAIGDSWTYGAAASPSESWPRWLEHDEGLSVYNLAVFGFGPTDYRYLLETTAPDLEPRTVIVGLSYSSDFLDAYIQVSRKEHWRRLRKPAHFDLDGPQPPAHSAGGLITPWEATKRWLRRSSLLWQLFETGPIVRTINDIGRRKGITDFTTCHITTEGPYATVISPGFAMDALDGEQPYVRAGVEITKELFLEMAEVARQMDFRFLVVIFPSKERVHEGRLAEADSPECLETFNRLMVWEERLDGEMKAFFQEHDIEHVDTLPALRAGARRARLFPPRWDVHPNGAGYRVIGRVIADRLGKPGSSAERAPSHVDRP